jgi:hypothetical protein
MRRGEISMDRDSAAWARVQAKQTALANGYLELAADRDHEVEAEEWTEGLIGDALDVDEETV